MIYFWMGKLWKQLNMVELFSRYALVNMVNVDVFLIERHTIFMWCLNIARVTIQDCFDHFTMFQAGELWSFDIVRIFQVGEIWSFMIIVLSKVFSAQY